MKSSEGGELFRSGNKAVGGHSDESAKREIERVNAKLRHFRGVAASVMNDAHTLWREIWDALQDARSYEEILDSVGESAGRGAEDDREEVLQKLHLLGIYIDYARRLCEGSIGQEPEDEREVEE